MRCRLEENYNMRARSATATAAETAPLPLPQPRQHVALDVAFTALAVGSDVLLARVAEDAPCDAVALPEAELDTLLAVACSKGSRAQRSLVIGILRE